MMTLDTPRLHLRPFRPDDFEAYPAMWAVVERATGAFVGRVGLHYPEGWPDREVGWTLARRFRGLGYATEAGRAAIEVAFGRLGWQRIISLIDRANVRSVRLAERLGERRDGEAVVRGHRVAVYVLAKADWTVAGRKESP